jgi:hypothetical protein
MLLHPWRPFLRSVLVTFVHLLRDLTGSARIFASAVLLARVADPLALLLPSSLRRPGRAVQVFHFYRHSPAVNSCS